jgi:hypothetical protein
MISATQLNPLTENIGRNKSDRHHIATSDKK